MDTCFVKAYPCETTEAFVDGHVAGFEFLGRVPLSILYDNLKIAVAKICGDGKREQTRAFTELVSQYLFADRFGRPGKGNVEGLVKYARANFLTPVPEAASFADLNALLAERCRSRQGDHAGRHAETPASGCLLILQSCASSLRWLWSRVRVSSTALVRYRGTTTRCRPPTGFRMSW